MYLMQLWFLLFFLSAIVVYFILVFERLLRFNRFSIGELVTALFFTREFLLFFFTCCILWESLYRFGIWVRISDRRSERLG